MRPIIRPLILITSVFLSILIYLLVESFIPSGNLRIIRLTQIYAFTTVVFLYSALLPGALFSSFPRLPLRSLIFKARRAIGVSAFYFGILHASFAFFGQLGGFEGLVFLNSRYLTAISLGFTALVILSCMAATSFDIAVYKLGQKWKLLHRFVYVAGILVVTHALLLGTHFQNLSDLIPVIFFLALFFLLLLESFRIDTFIQNHFTIIPRFGFSSVVLLGVSFWWLYNLLSPQSKPLSFGIHSQHVEIAKQIQNEQNNNPLLNSFPNIPGLKGDRTKRYSVDIDADVPIRAGQPTALQFHVYDASNGSPVTLFTRVYEKYMHLIIVDSTLTYFDHLHADDTSGEFIATFPKEGTYKLYLDYQPLGAIEQQTAITIHVGDTIAKEPSTQIIDKTLTKTFGDFEVTLDYPHPLKAEQVSVGLQRMTFRFHDAVSKKPITNLKPYLGAYGHLVMIEQTNYTYLHVHPTIILAEKTTKSGGPDVEFLPLGLYGPIRPGIYRVFAQFNPDGNLMVADYTIEIE